MTYASPQDLQADPLVKRSDDPRTEIGLGIAIIALFFCGLLGWAAVAPLDSASISPGVVVVAGHRQTVQTREGGVVTRIAVAEGQTVQAGQLLVGFASAEALATERTLAAQVIDREVTVARLRAEQADSREIAPPADAASFSPEEGEALQHALNTQRAELLSQLAANHARRAVLHQKVAEASQQIAGSQRQLEANQTQQRLNDQELLGMKRLQAQGYAPATRVRALERSAAALVGDAGAQAAEIARLTATQGEANLQIAQGDNERAQQVAAELDKAQSELRGLTPQLAAAREALARTQIRAPVSGAVVGLAVNTIGGVVGQGQKLLDIVPNRADLVVEAQVAPRDVEGLSVGNGVKVRLVGLHGRGVPILNGRLTQLSADAVSDEKRERSFYSATVAVPASELRRLQGQSADLKPGMPAEITVTLKKRTALQYMIGPLFQTFSGALHER
jgi:HlyD family secretion protein